MDIKDEILKIYNDPSTYDSVKFHEMYFSEISFTTCGISGALERNDNKEVSKLVKEFMLIEEWNGFMNDLSNEDVIREYRRWKEFCKWCDNFDWCKGFDIDKCCKLFH